MPVDYSKPETWLHPLEENEVVIDREEALERLQVLYAQARDAALAVTELFVPHEPRWQRLRNYEIAHRMNIAFPNSDHSRWRVRPPCPFDGDYC